MENEINLKLRSEILKMALQLENDVSKLILNYLNIESANRKALTNKSSNLSFKNRIDLLFDLEILNKEENELLLLMMEFRNQFLHNIDCNNFTVAVEFLGVDRGKKLLKFDNLTFKTELEIHYHNAFRALYIRCIDIILEKYDSRKNILEENRKALLAPHEYSLHLIDTLMNVFIKFAEENVPIQTDTNEIKDYKLKILQRISEDIDEIHSTESYKQLQEQFTSSFSTNQIKRFLQAF